MSFELIEEAKKIIAIHSITFDSNREIVDYLCDLLKPMNVQIELDKGKLFEKEQFNLIARRGPSSDDGLIFNTHLDTVTPGDYSLWDKTGGNPFRATIIDDKIYGLGTADVKLDMLCKIKALEKFKDTPFKKPLTIVGTFGEESGLVGAKKILEDKRVKGKYAVVGEPSNLSIVYAHKGHLVLDVTLTDQKAEKLSSNEKVARVDLNGKSAHSSTPHLGINAIEKGFEFLKRQGQNMKFLRFGGGRLINVIPDRASIWFKSAEALPKKDLEGVSLSHEHLEGDVYVFGSSFVECMQRVLDVFHQLQKEFRKKEMPEFDPATSLLSIGVIETNQNSLSMRIGIRTLPSLDSAALVESLKEKIQKVTQPYEHISASLSVLRESGSMMTNPDSPLIAEAKKTLRKLGLQDMVVTKSTCTEASVYKALGADTIIWGPGLSVGNVHRPNEFNYLHHLNHAVKFYENLIETFCVKGVA